MIGSRQLVGLLGKPSSNRSASMEHATGRAHKADWSGMQRAHGGWDWSWRAAGLTWMRRAAPNFFRR